MSIFTKQVWGSGHSFEKKEIHLNNQERDIELREDKACGNKLASNPKLSSLTSLTVRRQELPAFFPKICNNFLPSGVALIDCHRMIFFRQPRK